MKKEEIAFLLLFFTGLGLIGLSANMIYQNQELLESNYKLNSTIRRYKLMTNEKHMTSLKNTTRLNGVYFGDYTCIWIEGRTYESYIETANHEWMHHKYRNNWEHFDHDCEIK
jgi:hypothetical protein